VNATIGSIDVAVLIAYLAAVVLLGLWVGRRQRNLAGYLLGGRNLAWWMVLLSIVATETSTVTFLSVPGKAFDADSGNLCFLQLALGFILGRMVVIFLFLPHYFRGKLFTAYEVLDHRFGGATKQTASALFLVTRNLADGLRLYLTAIVLHHAAGLDLTLSIAAIGVLTILYTFVGGMKSVAVNDCIQFVVYMAGAVLAAVILLDKLPGGWAGLMEFATERDKLRVFDFRLDPTQPLTFAAGLIGGAFLSLATHGTDQLMVQRYLAAGSRKKASAALGLSGLIVCVQFALFLAIGVGLACYYHHFPAEQTFEKNDEAFATFIIHGGLPVGAVGLILAAVFSAAMSTLSSSLNSSAAAALNDLYLPRCREKPPDESLLRIGRRFTVLFGLVQIGVAIIGLYVAQSVVDSVLSIAGFTAGVILGVFFLGTLTKHVSQRGALAGLVGGLAVMTIVAFATPLAWPWYAVVGSAATFAIGLIGERLLGATHGESPHRAADAAAEKRP